MAYTFFFSHARDDYSPYMDHFLTDLREEVRGLLGMAQADNIEYRDKQEMDIGLPWRPDLLNGLQESRVIVCLYTPRYFQRPICGKEAGFFLERQKLLPNPPKHSFVLPILWIPCEDKIPQPLKDLTFDHDDFPEEYRTLGLERLKKLSNKYGDKYMECVTAFADRIRNAIEKEALLPKLDPAPVLEQVPNAFLEPSANPAKPGVAPAEPQITEGPACVQFFYAIARPGEFKEKTPPPDPTVYDGRGGQFYRCTASGRLLGPLASNIASSPELEMVPENRIIDEEFPDRLREARDAKNPVVVFVDPWTVHKVDSFRQRMAEYEDHRSDHCSVLILWSKDRFTEDNRAILEARIQATFPVNATRDKIHFRPDVGSEDALTAGLRESLERLRHKIIEQGKVERLLATSAKPTIDIAKGAAV